MVFTKLLSISNHRVLTQKNRYIDPVGFKKKKLHRLCQNPVFKMCITVLMHRMRNTNNILTEY